MRYTFFVMSVCCAIALYTQPRAFGEEDNAKKESVVEPKPDEQADAPANPLAGEWILKFLAGATLPDDVAVPKDAKAPTLKIAADGTVSGFSGVNRVMGKLAGTEGKLFGPLAGTRMAGPPQAMKLETAFLQALEKAMSGKRAEKQLQLFDSQGKLLAEFVAVSAKEDKPVAGGEEASAKMPTGKWILESLTGLAIPADAEVPYLEIKEDGSVAGFGGVNRVFGKIVNIDGKFFGPLGSTMMAGPPEAAKLEMAFLKALGKVASAKTSTKQLQLLDAEGKVLAEFAAGEAADK